MGELCNSKHGGRIRMSRKKKHVKTLLKKIKKTSAQLFDHLNVEMSVGKTLNLMFPLMYPMCLLIKSAQA